MAEAPFKHVELTVLDGVGCGEASDTRSQYPEDVGTNALANASQVNPLYAPALQAMGLEHIPGLEEMRVTEGVARNRVRGAFGALDPTFAGNGSPEGHQGLMGHVVEAPYLLFNTEEGFPPEVTELVRDTIARIVGRDVEIIRYPGTDDINGVKFVNHRNIGPAHLQSGEGDGPLKVPIYASSDSLIQIALHQGVIPQEQIEIIGKAVRKAVDDARIRIGRIIMRPFIGGPDEFTRVSADRRDYGVDPDEPTLANHLSEAGVHVYGIGKAASMLNYSGFDPANLRKLKTDEERMAAIAAKMGMMSEGPNFGFSNIIGNDELWGHPRKPAEWMQHMAMIDSWVQRGVERMTDNDLWLFTADHGNDPTQKAHTNHTRERSVLLAYSPRLYRPIDLGVRTSFADVAKTVAENFGVGDKIERGKSFLPELLR